MPRSAPPLALHLDVAEDASSSALSAAVVRALVGGQLADGDVLPSTRVLAAALGVPRVRVVEAYLQLTAAGFAITAPVSATRIERGARAAARAGAVASFGAVPAPAAPPRVVSRDVRFDLRPGYPDAALINSRDWSRAWRQADVLLFDSVRTAIQTIARVASDPARSLAFENPGYSKALRAFQQNLRNGYRRLPVTSAPIVRPPGTNRGHQCEYGSPAQ